MPANYIPKKKPGARRRNIDPNTWITGPDLNRRNKYYAYLKHKAQARYRGESYSLSFQEWETLWQDDVWEQRGKTADSLCLAQIDCKQGWHVNNLEIIPRKQQVSRTHNGRRKQK